ncbi:MAG TPA: hypothetical protein VH853_07585 [Polyangia bacterium]|jgi:hypothetical protein|nr:hypothetical protein [Polyangia bacterium]
MRRDDDPSRLSDDEGLDPWLVGLLRSTGPYKSPPGRKQRVLLSLGRSTGRRAPFVLRPAIAVGVLIGCGAFASAALGPWRGWIDRTYERLVPSSAATAASSAGERARARRSIAAPTVALVGPPRLTAPVPAAPPPSPSFAPASRELVAPPHAHHVAPPAPSAPAGRAQVERAQPQAQTEEETQIVLEGMRALRLDKNPVRARALLARYLERRPNGALAEEALALSIEAAVAHHDADAATLGARYVRRYPAGRFTALALQSQR